MSDKANVENKLKHFPSLFNALPTAGITNEQLSVNKLHYEDFEDTDVQESRNQNLVSYAYYVSGENVRAYELNEKVLTQHPTNMLALSNKAWFYFKEKKYPDAIQVISTIDAIPDKEEELLVAKGELAYAYARFRLKTYDLAVNEYENALNEYNRRQLSDKYDKYFCMWSFGLFFLIHRKKKISKTFSDSEGEDKQLKILRSVTKLSTRDKSAMKYQGKCYANIGRILYAKVCRTYSGKEKFVRLRREPLSALEDAYILGYMYGDVYTLDLVGKFFRYYKEKVPQSIQCLERSVRLRETCKGYHRLALAKKREIEMDEIKIQPKSEAVPNQNIVTLMKCQKTPNVTLVHYRNNPRMNDILENLDKATELGRKTMVFYDYGLTYRQLKEHLKAKEKFEHIIKSKEGPRTCLHVANAYEQIGYCIDDAIRTGTCTLHSEERQAFQTEMQSSFKKSVEMSCSLLRMVPSLPQLWLSVPTLNQLLIGNARTKSDCTELSFLYERLRSQEALDILERLRNVSGYLSRNDQRITDILNELLMAKKFDDAAIVIGLITCIPGGFEAIDENLYANVLIQGGLQAHACNQSFLGRFRIIEALALKKNKLQLKNEEQFTDILTNDLANLHGTGITLMFDNESAKHAADTIAALLNEVGVIIRICQPTIKMTFDENKSTMIHYIVVVGGNNEEPSVVDSSSLDEAMGNLSMDNFDTNIDLILDDLCGREYGNLLVVKLQDITEVTAKLQDFHCICFNDEKARQLGKLDKEDMDFVAELLQIIATE